MHRLLLDALATLLAPEANNAHEDDVMEAWEHSDEGLVLMDDPYNWTPKNDWDRGSSYAGDPRSALYVPLRDVQKYSNASCGDEFPDQDQDQDRWADDGGRA